MEVQTLEKKVTPVINEAMALVVKSPDAIEEANGKRQVIKALMKEVDETFDPIISKQFAAHREAVAQKKRHYEPLKQAYDTLGTRIGEHMLFLKQEEEKEAKRLEDIARAEREREIQKAQKRMDALLGKAEGLEEQKKALEIELDREDLTETEREMICSRLSTLSARIAQTVEKAAEKQAEIEQVAAAPQPVISVNTAPKVKGMSFKQELIPEVVNPMAIIKAIADERIPVALVKQFDMVLMKRLINSGIHIPGTKTTTGTQVRTR